MNRHRLRDNWDRVRERVAAAAVRSGRGPSAVTVVAVTKRNPPELVRALVEQGATDLGENYPQELWGKVAALSDLATVRWHLIGHLQTNKVKRTAPLVGMIHAVDSLRLLQAIIDHAASSDAPPSVCLQVNTSAEASKHGWSPEEIERDAEAIAALAGSGRVPVVGLMTIAGYGTSDDEARPAFRQLRAVRDALRVRTGLALTELSMGMSGDFEAAIQEGATLVRVGSAFFEGVADEIESSEPGDGITHG